MDAPHISPAVLRFFRRIVRGYFRRHFRAVRISQASILRDALAGPLIIYANHSSWWDPMVSVLLAESLLPTRRHFAPMDAAALARYGILKRVGVFGVELNSPRGAAKFLRAGLQVLADGGVLWVTPQGRFADPRQRPLEFKAGLAALATRVSGGCTIIPLAIEYPFWDERLPETLLHFGTPVYASGQTAAVLEAELRGALLTTMDTLAAKSIARDPRRLRAADARTRRHRRLLRVRSAHLGPPARTPVPGRAQRVRRRETPVMLAIAIVAFVCALIPALMFVINLRLYTAPPPVSGSLPAVSILIPARNEAHGIASAIEHALGSRDVEVEVIVMDDSSTDGTDAVVLALADQDPRLRLERAPALPDGWNGKQHACWALAHTARYSVLCFVDADVRPAAGVRRPHDGLPEAGATTVW